MKYLEKISGGFMIMDKPTHCVTNSRWRNGMGDGGRRFTRRGSVDSGLNGTNHVNMHPLKEKTSCEKKVTNDTKKCSSYMICKKDSRSESVPNNKTPISSEKTPSPKTRSCHSELRPILKSGRNSGSLEGESPSCAKDKQTTETRFSYRLPVAPRPTIRKSVSFRENLLDEVCSKRRFSSPSLTFSLETTGITKT